MIRSNVGVLLTNIGTPAKPTPTEVRRYLKKFLSDTRVVEIPKIIWWPILHGIILPTRSKRSAKLYQKIWTQQGSPLLLHTQKITEKLQKNLQIPVAFGMHYSNPSIENALLELQSHNVTKIVVLPLYPQYSGTTTASSFDAVTNVLKKWRSLPEIHTINHYANNPDYIQALSATIRQTWKKYGKAQHLLFSFHGIPQRYVNAGDPYPILCQQTAHAVASELQLLQTDWSISFQSRLGRGGWLMPYTDKALESFPQKGITDLHVICPGFAADCLETLEEINMRGKEQFFHAGGKSFHYISALNHCDDHINLLTKIINQCLQGWI